MNTVLSIVVVLVLIFPNIALGIDVSGVSRPSVRVNERLLPINAIKASSEVQLRRVQKLMAENRDQTFEVLSRLKFSSKINNN